MALLLQEEEDYSDKKHKQHLKQVHKQLVINHRRVSLEDYRSKQERRLDLDSRQD